jgi:ATP-dependent Clp protease ATP-binding subunit ClpC
MFERYTESARRALFFARYEVSQLGATAMGTEHLLLGLIRENKGLIARVLARSLVSAETIRKDVENRSTFREKISTSVEIPFGADTTRALQSAAEEADRLHHHYIGTEHLLLGLLRTEGSVAAAILARHGLRADDVHETIVNLYTEAPPQSQSPSHPHVFELVRTVNELVDQLGRLAHDSRKAEALVELIRQRLDELERFLGR